MISVKRKDKKNVNVHVLKWSNTLDTDEQHYHKSVQNISVYLRCKYKEQMSRNSRYKSVV